MASHRFTQLALGVYLASVSLAGAASYYVDPATGSMTNPGTAALPWSTLEAVFAANKTFAGGDTIYCRTGYHGFPTIKKANATDVTIMPDAGATPTLKMILFNTAASHWVVDGFDICPENAGAGLYAKGNLVDIESAATLITIRNCTIRGVNSIDGYTINDWYNNVPSGIFVRATNNTFSNCYVKNISFGIQTYKGANFTLISHCTVENFYNDAMRGLGDDCIYEYCVVKNSYVSDANHDDCFQSWSVGTDGKVGTGTVYRATLRNNYFIALTDPNQPLFAPPQGMGCFDGFFEGWVIENNVLSLHTWHGISLYGATNCTITNNTVVQNPYAITETNNPTPWIHIYEHKPVNSTTPWPVTSSGNVLRNNYAANGVGMDHAYDGVADHNLSSKSYATLFVDYPNLNFMPRPNSPLIGAGSATGAPVKDFFGYTRTDPYDIGAIEYRLTYPVWCILKGLTGNNALPSTILANDGLNNLYKYALGLEPTTIYNPGAQGQPTVTIPNGTNFLAMTYTGIAGDVRYDVQATNDLTGNWSTISSYNGTLSAYVPPGTVTIQDTQATNLSEKRFLRLQMTLQ